MTIKLKMKDRETAYNLKEEIRDYANTFDYISVKEVLNFINFDGSITETIEGDDDKRGWRWSDLKGNNIMVRTLKDGTTWLYLCDPPLKINKYIPDELCDGCKAEEKDPDDIFLDKLYELIVDVLAMQAATFDGRRKVMVHRASKKKNVIAEEYPCWFHCWTANQIVKDNGTMVSDLLAVCEFQDGHIERVKFDHVIFVNEWN